MSFAVAVPEALAAAANDIANIGSTLASANSAAAAPTAGVLAAGADEVSAAVASMFSGYANTFQGLSAQASSFHEQFVQALATAGNSYAVAEAANANPLQTVQQELLGLINTPTQTLLGRPLIGNGAPGVPAVSGVRPDSWSAPAASVASAGRAGSPALGVPVVPVAR
jgi:PE family